MLATNDKIFSNLFLNQSPFLAHALKRGDWQNTREILLLGAEKIISLVESSGLRGRGGAGFSTGRKWRFIPQDSQPHYLVVNGDESEPGTCKDREILRREPHKIIEGALIAARAINAHQSYIYLRGEFLDEFHILQKAIDECYTQGLIGENACDSGFSFNIHIHRGAGAYICGEESALLESLEGKKGQPRLKPPFPAQKGLYNCPTVINNIETLACIPTILRRGPQWFSNIGPENNRGSKIFCISGNVNKPIVVEEVMGIPLKTLIDTYAEGIEGGENNLAVVIPGGSSMPLIPAQRYLEIYMDFTTLERLGSGLGSGGIIIINKQHDILLAIARIAQFYMKESCGQCSPCREGTGWVWRLLMRIAKGQGHISDIDKINSIIDQMEYNTICALGTAAAWSTRGLIKNFHHLLIEKIKNNTSITLNKDLIS